MMALKSKYMLWVILLLSVVLTSCLKEDERVAPHQPGQSTEGSFNMGTNYRYQSYFDFASNSFVGQNSKGVWDLGFETTPQGFAIITNGAKFCKIKRTGNSNFDAVTDTAGNPWRVDVLGYLDSTAIGTWGTYSADTAITNGVCYIIDRGYDESNNYVGFKKFIIEGANSTSYTITYANLDGTEKYTTTVTKRPGYNFTFFSLNGAGAEVDVEPTADTWDISFTQYIYIYRTVEYPNFPYLVVGVVLNSSNVAAAADSVSGYENIVLADTANMEFHNQLDIIGYNWKQFDGTSFIVKPQNVYVVRNRNGLYYKIHFTDFYKDGIKGNIAFEFQQL